MSNSFLLHHLIFSSAQQFPNGEAVQDKQGTLTYKALANRVHLFAQRLIQHKIGMQERIAVYLEKRSEFVVTCFGSACAGNIFVPINPILKPEQVLHILNDAEAQVLVTSAERYAYLEKSLAKNKSLVLVILVDEAPSALPLEDQEGKAKDQSKKLKTITVAWPDFNAPDKSSDDQEFPPQYSARARVDADAVSLFYTSGSTGLPKGVVLSHRNMVIGAKSVASYLENCEDDVLLAALPLSFDAGFSQLTTAFCSAAKVILLNYILPKDVLSAVVNHKVTGITAVPPLWIQIADLKWPDSVDRHLRYFANTGGRMPLEILNKLRAHFPSTKPFLMYGLTEAFRSTYLPPDEVDRRPGSIGKAIPNAEILVLDGKGEPCGPRQPGELVHRGALVALGYWRDPVKTAERYKPLPANSKIRPDGIVLPELAVFSGDIVEMDEEGFLYFIGRNDEMIKTSGYRVSPSEIEEVIFASGVAKEVVAFGVTDRNLGQKIVVSVYANLQDEAIRDTILAKCKEQLPAYMIPAEVIFRSQEHPRNPNGKLDRKSIAQEFNKSE